MTYLFLLAFGAVCLAIGWKTSDEVHRIAAMGAGGLSSIWGAALAPSVLQISLELVVVIAMFSICIRCLEGGTKHD